MRSLALVAAAAATLGVLLAGYGSGGGGCNVRIEACDEDLSSTSSGDGGGIDPWEHWERNDTPVEPERDSYAEGYYRGMFRDHHLPLWLPELRTTFDSMPGPMSNCGQRMVWMRLSGWTR